MTHKLYINAYFIIFQSPIQKLEPGAMPAWRALWLLLSSRTAAAGNKILY